MANEADIQAAISDLKSQEASNFTATAKKLNTDRTTLIYRFQGKTLQNIESRSRNRKLLTKGQKAVLIEHIRELLDCRLHLIPKLSQNMVVDIVGRPFGGRYFGRF